LGRQIAALDASGLALNSSYQILLIPNLFKIITADNGALGLVRGEGNFRVIFDLIPREANVKEGSSVVTTGFEGIFPEGILVGEIKKIEKNDVTPFQRAKVEPAFNIKELNAVFIISDF